MCPALRGLISKNADQSSPFAINEAGISPLMIFVKILSPPLIEGAGVAG